MKTASKLAVIIVLNTPLYFLTYHHITTSYEIQRRLPPNRGGLADCVDDCQAFRRYFDPQRGGDDGAGWPTYKPRAAVYFLVRSRHSSLSNLSVALETLDRYFSDRFRYPVVVFHEPDLTNVANLSEIRSMTRSKVFFQEVRDSSWL